MDELKGFSPAMLEHFKKLGKTDEEIAAFAGSLAKQGQAAREAGLESKEADTPPAEAAAAVVEVAQPEYATREDVTLAMAAVLQEIRTELGSVKAAVKALQVSDEEKIAKAAAATPRASIYELASQMAVGNPAAQIDGRTALAKAGPKQAEAEIAGYTASPLLNRFMQQSIGGGQ